MTNDRFRESLKVQLTDAKGKPIFKTIKELSILMHRKGFHSQGKPPIDIQPTKKQLDYAWKYLRGFSQLELKDFGITTTDRTGQSHKRDPVTGRFM